MKRVKKVPLIIKLLVLVILVKLIMNRREGHAGPQDSINHKPLLNVLKNENWSKEQKRKLWLGLQMNATRRNKKRRKKWLRMYNREYTESTLDKIPHPRKWINENGEEVNGYITHDFDNVYSDLNDKYHNKDIFDMRPRNI
jgi:hypothetical protein